jgi:hypothetical protein
MRTALIVVITLALMTGAQAQTRANRLHRVELRRPPAKSTWKHGHECEAHFAR